MAEEAIYAAGAVIWRRNAERAIEVLLVHRTEYNDVTIPKGKVDPGETMPMTAVREMKEETGLDVRLGVPIGVAKYEMPSGRDKIVHYWAAKATKRAIRESTFVPNNEISGLEWLLVPAARKALSYDADIEILDNFAALVREDITDTYAVILARHGKAEPVGANGEDAQRPLSTRGQLQAKGLAEAVAPWGVKRIVSSTALRCVQTVTPLASALGLEVETSPLISQDAYEAGDDDARTVVGKLIRKAKGAVVCSHGPVIPEVLRELALATATASGSYLRDASQLETGAYTVVHISKKHPGSGIITIETYHPQEVALS